MNSLNTIRTIVAGSNNTLAIATQELPAALVNQPQPGNANTIGAIYAHALLTLDHFYQTAMQDKAQLLTTAGFATRLGLVDPDQLPWATLNTVQWDWEALQAYGQAVLAAVDAYLATLTDAELARPCQLFGQDSTVAEAISVATWHTALHAGEIAALKGVNTLKGLPF